jgi:hypothetical protein
MDQRIGAYVAPTSRQRQHDRLERKGGGAQTFGEEAAARVAGSVRASGSGTIASDTTGRVSPTAATAPLE